MDGVSALAAHNICLVPSPTNILGNIISQKQNRHLGLEAKNTSGVVYGALCKECEYDKAHPFVYIGETSQLLKERMNGHFYHKNEISGIREHMMEHNHSRPDIHILEVQPDIHLRKFTEAAFIEKLLPSNNHDRGISRYLHCDLPTDIMNLNVNVELPSIKGSLPRARATRAVV